MNEQEQQPIQQPPAQEIVIRLLPDGQMQINSTTPNKIVSLGMLEMAKAAIMAQNQGPPQQGILQARGMLLPKRNGG